MDYLDPNVHCPEKAVKTSSLTHLGKCSDIIRFLDPWLNIRPHAELKIGPI